MKKKEDMTFRTRGVFFCLVSVVDGMREREEGNGRKDMWLSSMGDDSAFSFFVAGFVFFCVCVFFFSCGLLS